MIVVEAVLGFFAAHGFVFELSVCTMLFVAKLARRRYYGLRAAIAGTVLLGASFLWTLVPVTTVLTETARYLLYFALILFGIKFIYNISFWAAVFCLTAACASQHAAFKLGDLVMHFVGGHVGGLAAAALYVLAEAVVIVAIYFYFAKKTIDDAPKLFQNKTVIVLSILLVILVTLIQNVFEASSDTLEASLYILFAVYDFLSCFFIMFLLYGMYKSGKLEREKRVMEQVVHMQEAQFKATKENVDLINIKCHDLRKQVSLFEDRIGADEVRELKRTLRIYDSSVKSGNEVFDVIIAEKSLYCASLSIKFMCIVDGSLLGFMSAFDIYALFGNAFDNAVTALEKLPEKENRVIDVVVKESMGMVSVHIENACCEKLFFVDGLPVTTKEDDKYHGFGMKSIKRVAEKYGGFFSAALENGIFSLDVLIPLQGKTE